jgi:hypothetical protein
VTRKALVYGLSISMARTNSSRVMTNFSFEMESKFVTKEDSQE